MSQVDEGTERVGRAAVEERLREHGLGPRWLDMDGGAGGADGSGPGAADGVPARLPEAFAGLAFDSRRVRPGQLFCAVRGVRHDGHDFLAEAARAGAAAAVVERPVPDVELPQLRVSDGRLAASHLASLFRGDPSAGLRLIGVTGTNGKTTTAWILRHLLAGTSRAGALGTLGRVMPDGHRTSGELTTPGPLQLADALRELRDGGAEVVAMEVSSHALDQRRVDALRFHAVAFTSFSRDHLDYHGAIDDYLDAKLRLLDLLAPGGRCVVNADEPAWAPVLERWRGASGAAVRDAGGQASGGATSDEPSEWSAGGPITYGLSEAARIRAADVRLGPTGSRWRLETPEDAVEVALPMPGEFNVRNALAAAALAAAEGIGVEAIAARLSDVPPVPGRMEVLAREPALVLRDYAHTPDAYRRVLGEIAATAAGRVFVVFGAAGDRDPGKWPVMARIAAEHAERVLVTTDNPRSEDPADLARRATAGLPEGGYEVVLDRREAIRRALELAGPEDVVVLLGKGHETYQVVGDRRLPFDEAAIVAELTGDRGAGGSAASEERP